MNVRKKTMLASGLGALAAAVWVPALANLTSAPGLPPVESPAEGPEGAPRAEAGAEEDPDEPESEGTVGARELDGLDTLEARTADLDSERPEDDLAALLAALAEPLESAPGIEVGAGTSFDLQQSARLELADFAAANAVSGVIHGPGGSVALLGHRVVREGELLPGGRIRVAKIGPGGLELTAEGESRLLALPAFRAREASLDGPKSSTPLPAEPTTLRSEPLPPDAAANPSEKGAGA